MIVDYESLKSEYLNSGSLAYKKLQIVDRYVEKGDILLDIGIGTGELIELEKHKFGKVYGIDNNEEAVKMCKDRFKNIKNISVIRYDMCDIDMFNNQFHEKFDYITCLDVLEHIEKKECKKILHEIYNMTKNNGTFIFSGPGIFEKIKIYLDMSPTHKYSCSSYGWKKMIEDSGFRVIHIETVEFPLVHSNFLRKKLHILGKCCLIISKK